LNKDLIKKIYKKLKSFFSSSNSAKGGVVFLAMSLSASALNYIFQLLGRKILPNEEFGGFGSFMSIFNLISASILSAFQIAVAVHIAKNSSKKNLEKFIQSSFIFGTLLFLFSSILGIFYESLGFSSPWIFINLGTSMLFGGIGASLNGALQGHKKFMVLGFASVFVAIAKISFFLIFAFFVGKNVLSASISQTIASIFIILPGTWFFLKNKNLEISKIFDVKYVKSSFFETIKFLKNSSDKFVGVALFTAFYSIDLILINALKSKTFASEYSTISLFVKILLFPIVAINGIFLPYIAENSKNYQAIKRISKIFFSLVFLITTTGISFYIFATDFVFKILMLSEFSYLSDELRTISIFGFFLAISSAFFYFFNALKEIFTNFVLGIGIFLEVFFIINSSSTHNLAKIVWISSFFVFLGFLALFFKKIFEIKNSKKL